MNKKGTSDVFLVILQMLIVGLVLAFMIAKVGAVDISFLKRTIVVQNLGMVMSAISFLPGSFSYAYLTEYDEKMADWLKFPAKINDKDIFYDEKAENVNSGNVKYQLFMNDIQYDQLNRLVMLKKKAIFIEKANKFITSDKVNEDLRKLVCEKVTYDLKVKSLNGGDETKFYTAEGEEVTNVNENYVNMEKQYFQEQNRVYPGNRGLKNEDQDEATITQKLAELINPVTDVLIQPETLSEKHILLTVGEYESTKNFMIIYAPITTFEDDYKIGCNILNNVLDTELKDQIDGIAIIPSLGNHIIFEVGNMAKPNNPLLISEDNLMLIAEGIKNE
ncbi:hypothetical protein HN592_05315 [Candidatus Woesearchaeota archaeon]|nr:hypothetical protein [Candidatus Woesearchaeota archaeon]MBT4367805.1 hypothetical protein [Candidatus Woesearchaeota archaeon]MBT4712293.1 hypothetical protein [Candidatus Woesearchaeota archaeon]MBT6638841.1 hypothetical protein [Candidatus Woesearchaeota archaeon]MBT7134485.1 hypothetical protein [Candidatus Woesearchaeota archaeon]